MSNVAARSRCDLDVCPVATNSPNATNRGAWPCLLYTRYIQPIRLAREMIMNMQRFAMCSLLLGLCIPTVACAVQEPAQTDDGAEQMDIERSTIEQLVLTPHATCHCQVRCSSNPPAGWTSWHNEGANNPTACRQQAPGFCRGLSFSYDHSDWRC